jgi:hypothetical protein
MESSTRYAINSPRVIHESFEQELVIVNLDTGRYYCLQEAGVPIWSALSTGASAQEIAEIISETFEADGETLTRAIRDLVNDLLDEQLIVVRATEATGDRAARRAPLTDGAKRPFLAPTLQKYTDMQDLLLLDPIHEVDASGWPVPAPPLKPNLARAIPKTESDPPA